MQKNSDLNKKLATLNTKAELKAEQGKIVKLQTHGLNHFLGKSLFGDGGSRNVFVYWPTLDTLELKKRRVLIMFLVGNQRRYTLPNLSHYILLSYIA